MSNMQPKPLRTLPANCKLNDYQEVSSETAIYPGAGTPLGLIYTALKVNGEAGEFAEHVGKAMRDDGYAEINVHMTESEGHPVYDMPLMPDRKEKLILELGDILWYVGAAARELGVSLQYVAERNITKLQDRQSRNALSGSGDER